MQEWWSLTIIPKTHFGKTARDRNLVSSVVVLVKLSKIPNELLLDIAKAPDGAEWVRFTSSIRLSSEPLSASKKAERLTSMAKASV